MSQQRKELVDALVDDSASGYERVLSKTLLKQLRSVLQDSLEAHPVAADLVDEQVTRTPAEQSGEQPAGEVRQAIAEKRAKSSG